jgi:nucleotide-binding universal stress UspA family protein
MYKNVVVGTDGSNTADKAVEAAAELARQWNAVLHIVTGYRTGSGAGHAAGSPMGGGADGGAADHLQHEAADQVGSKAAATWAEGLITRNHAVSGHPADAILDTAQTVGADLIVVGSKGMQGARRFLGSVPNSVAHGAPCSVLIVKTV